MRTGTIARLVVIALTVCLTAASATQAQTPEDKAQAWLAVVDAGSYDQSWGAAAAYFRGAVGEDQWHQTMVAVRRPLGRVLSRKAAATTHVTELPGAPDGQYVVVQFSTSFENKRVAVETVTPMMQNDGSWGVAGYFIK